MRNQKEATHGTVLDEVVQARGRGRGRCLARGKLRQEARPMTASRESESMHRIRCWTPHWQRFDGWSYQTGKPEDTLLAAVSRSLPEAHSHLFHWPHETIWEIQRQVHGSEHCSYRPLLAVTLSFFFNDTATTEIYTLSLHDALPICHGIVLVCSPGAILSLFPGFQFF